MVKSLVITLAGLLLLSLATGGLRHDCENCPSSRAMLPFRHNNNPHNISVTYTVVDGVNHSFNDSISVTVPKISFFLNVMESAQDQNSAKFSFKYNLTKWGAYINTVRGVEADPLSHTYWQLLSNGNPLQLGAACYKVSHRERLEVRFTTY